MNESKACSSHFHVKADGKTLHSHGRYVTEEQAMLKICVLHKDQHTGKNLVGKKKLKRW